MYVGGDNRVITFAGNKCFGLVDIKRRDLERKTAVKEKLQATDAVICMNVESSSRFLSTVVLRYWILPSNRSALRKLAFLSEHRTMEEEMLNKQSVKA